MGTPLTSAFDTYVTQFPNLAENLYSSASDDTIWKDIMDLKGPDWSPLNHAVVTHKVYGLDIMVQRSDTSPFTFDTPGPEGTKESIFSNYGLGVVFTENLIMDGLYNIVEQVMADLKNVWDLTHNVQVGQMYDDAFTGTLYTAYDGQPILSTSRTSQPGIVRQNAPTVPQPLSYTGVQTVLTLMRRFKSERGRPKPMIKNNQSVRVLMPPEMEFEADRIFDTGSAYEPDTPNNAINVLKKHRWSPIINPYLTSTTNWFLMPEQENMLRFVERQPMTEDHQPDIETKGVRQDVRGRWVIHVEDFDRIFGSNG
jgi:hypothetical protein